MHSPARQDAARGESFFGNSTFHTTTAEFASIQPPASRATGIFLPTAQALDLRAQRVKHLRALRVSVVNSQRFRKTKNRKQSGSIPEALRKRKTHFLSKKSDNSASGAKKKNC